MKQKEFLELAVVVVISFIVGIFVPKLIFSSNHDQQIEKVPSISDTFQTPSSQYFNSKAIDVTPYITVGNSNNTQPFSSSTQ